jgi:RimJ/RimL family protein N-acetyltransferase
MLQQHHIAPLLDISHAHPNDPSNFVALSGSHTILHGIATLQYWLPRETFMKVHAILLGDDPIGLIGLTGFSPKKSTLIWLVPNKRNQGLGKPALQQSITRNLAENPTLKKIVGFIEPSNTPSIRLHESVGFEPDSSYPADVNLKAFSLTREKAETFIEAGLTGYDKSRHIAAQ